MHKMNKESFKPSELQLDINVLSIDLEDYFMVSAFENVVRRKDWGRYESRIERSTYQLLEILNNVQLHNANNTPSMHKSEPKIHRSPKATFFCLGWVAERFPHLIKEIHSQGHEIASHGYNHRTITSMSNKEFREDVRKSKAILEDLIGVRILGYRAPSYSITRRTLWALQILAEEGYLYDSSIFPIHHDRYGIPNAPRYPFYIELGDADILSQLKAPKYIKNIRRCDDQPGTKKSNSAMQDPVPLTPHPAPTDFIIEFPLSTIRLFGLNIPFSGGGYFRFLPLWFILWAVRHIPHNGNYYLIFYIHPWEIDPTQPKVQGISLISRFRHYSNIKQTENRLKKLLQVISFSSFYKILKD